MEDYLTITLFGQTYTFKFESDDLSGSEAVDMLLSEVKKVESQYQQSIHINKFVILMLAALNITLEKIALKNNYQHQLSKLSDRSAELIHRLDECIVPLSDSTFIETM
ncbi:MAG: cell division protein ZapA [Deltaproteobacteria bacterium]|nr:cell division protein ZapA [Deltaproteobacteria bacterium]